MLEIKLQINDLRRQLKIRGIILICFIVIMLYGIIACLRIFPNDMRCVLGLFAILYFSGNQLGKELIEMKSKLRDLEYKLDIDKHG